ncbi:MAG: GPI anchored serine-threonine rich family protein [Acidobacteria bacterium]|nr:GPI anchored serine-threonine rich family protein [Acidobacteriota bacterium]
MIMRRFVVLAMLSLLLSAGERSIRIEFPNGGEVLARGSRVAVQWRTLGIEGSLAILLFKGGEQHAVIAASVPDSGQFQWTVAASLPVDGRYRLRICSLRDLRINDFSDRDFTIK